MPIDMDYRTALKRLVKIHKQQGAARLLGTSQGRVSAWLRHVGENYDPSTQCDKSHHAIANAQYFVRQRLISPASAEFPWGNESFLTTYRGDCEHFVVGYVDSQNAFGAMIRTHFYATVKMQNRQPYNWTFIDLETF